jgi:hypothetical protein
MEYANILVAIGGDGAHQVPKYNVTPAEVLVLKFLHGDQAITDVDVQGELPKAGDWNEGDDEALKPRTDRQEIERLRALYSRQDGDVVISPAVTALFGNGIGKNVPKTFADLELDESQYIAKERKTSAKKSTKAKDDDAQDGEKSLDDMTINELRAEASKEPEVDLTGLTSKADILEAVKKQRTEAGSTNSVFE